MSTTNSKLIERLLEQTQAALSLQESGTMIAMTIEEQQRLLNQYGWFDFMIGDFLIRRIHEYEPKPHGHEAIKAAIKELVQGANPPLATACESSDTGKVSERYERENDHLIHALHDMRAELIRATEGLRSLSIVLAKSDLGNMEKVNMKISELNGAVTEIKTNALKAFSEIRGRIDVLDARILTLEKQLADADIPAEAEATIADLKTLSKQLDDIVPDAPELPPVVNPPVPV